MPSANDTSETRTERDSMGEIAVPASALWGAQTQRALSSFGLSELTMPRAFVAAVAEIKWAAARAQAALGLLDAEIADAIAAAALEVASGEHAHQFPVDVFQTGSGTSTNMNVNEVIASLASRAIGRDVHPNDHVNLGQSSNDVIPSAIHLSSSREVEGALLPALTHLAERIEARGSALAGFVKTGRTHLMDAMPIRLDQELGGWAAQIRAGHARIAAVLPRLTALAIGGTAVGTGINAHPELGTRVAALLSERTGLGLHEAPSYFEAQSSQDTAVELSGQLKTVAVSLMKIANDLRWMGSGPLAGLGEITLPALQPGSSIMPGKVNPVIPEACAMVAAKVIGNDMTITVAGQSGSFQLNVMLPVIAHTLLESIGLLARAARALADRAIDGLTVSAARIAGPLARNPMLVTALTPVIGYERAAAIAKRAYAEGAPIREVALRETDLSSAQLDALLDPAALTRGGRRA